MFDGKHILVVDDDPEILDAVGEYLELRRFRVSFASNGIEMKKVLNQFSVDLILLDVGLPGTNGIALAGWIKLNYACGVIMLTGLGDTEDRVLGLESGADDYVVKPFNFRELLARINSLLRRLQAPHAKKPEVSTDLIKFGNWSFDKSDRTLISDNGGKPELSAGELDILTTLAENADFAVSRNDILEKSSHRKWSPLDRSIDVRITRLRKKLEKDPRKPKLIRTARNTGYILCTNPSD